MATMHVYLNFDGTCEEAFRFYAGIFHAPLNYLMRFGEIPPIPDMPPIPDADKNKIMHTQLQINEHALLMGSDVLEGFGHTLSQGNGTYITLETKTADEINTLYAALSKDAKDIEMPLGEQFWAELYASFQDKFGVWWMLLFEGSKAER